MKALKVYIFLSLLLFGGFQLLLHNDFVFPVLITSYMADFLCMPVVLSICLLIAQYLKKDRALRLNLFTVFSLFLFYSFYFEGLLPRFHERYTADPIDVLMYFVGSVLFYFLQKK